MRKFSVGDAEHLDLDDESFNVVTCGFGVFFFPQPAAALETLRVLSADGRFAASTFTDSLLDYPWLPDVIDEMGLLGAMRARSGRTEPMLRADALSRILSSVGFERVTITTSEHRFVFRDVDAYLVWVRSHAFGALINRLSERESQDSREMRSTTSGSPGGRRLRVRQASRLHRRGAFLNEWLSANVAHARSARSRAPRLLT